MLFSTLFQVHQRYFRLIRINDPSSRRRESEHQEKSTSLNRSTDHFFLPEKITIELTQHVMFFRQERFHRIATVPQVDVRGAMNPG